MIEPQLIVDCARCAGTGLVRIRARRSAERAVAICSCAAGRQQVAVAEGRIERPWPGL